MLNFLFGNVGGKLKLFGKIACFLSFAIVVLAWIVLVVMAVKYKSVWMAFATIPALIAVAIGAWISSFYTIGFGQLVENTESIDKKLDDIIKANGERE